MEVKVLDLVDKVNLLGRLEVVLGGLWYRRAWHEIQVSRYGATSGTEAASILQKRGVRVWGARAVSDWFILHVAPQQAVWAESILLTQGCELAKVLPGARALAKLPTPWAETPKPEQPATGRSQAGWRAKLQDWL